MSAVPSAPPKQPQRKLSTYLRRPSLAVLQKNRSEGTDNANSSYGFRKMSLPGPRLQPEKYHISVPHPPFDGQWRPHVVQSSFANFDSQPQQQYSAPKFPPAGHFGHPQALHMLRAGPHMAPLGSMLNSQQVPVPPVAQQQIPAPYSYGREDFDGPQDVAPLPRVPSSENLAGQLLRKASTQLSEALFALDETMAIYASDNPREPTARPIDRGPRTLEEVRELRDAVAIVQDAFQSGGFMAITQAQQSKQAKLQPVHRKPLPSGPGDKNTVHENTGPRTAVETSSFWSCDNPFDLPRTESDRSDSIHSSLSCSTQANTSSTGLTSDANSYTSGISAHAVMSKKLQRHPSEPALRQQGWHQDRSLEGPCGRSLSESQQGQRSIDPIEDGTGKVQSSVRHGHPAQNNRHAAQSFTDSSLDVRLGRDKSLHSSDREPTATTLYDGDSSSNLSSGLRRKMSVQIMEKPPRPARSDTRRPSMVSTNQINSQSLSNVAHGRSRKGSISRVKTDTLLCHQPNKIAPDNRDVQSDHLLEIERDVAVDVPESPLRSPALAVELLVTPRAEEMNSGIAMARSKLGEQKSVTVPFLLGRFEGHQQRHGESGSRAITPRYSEATEDNHRLFRDYVETTADGQEDPLSSDESSYSSHDAVHVTRPQTHFSPRGYSLSRRPSGVSRRRPSTIVAGQVCDVIEGSPVGILRIKGDAGQKSDPGSDERKDESHDGERTLPLQSLPSSTANIRSLRRPSRPWDLPQEPKSERTSEETLVQTRHGNQGGSLGLGCGEDKCSGDVTARHRASSSVRFAPVPRPTCSSGKDDNDRTSDAKDRVAPLRLRRQPSIDIASHRGYEPRTSLIAEQTED